MDMPTVEQFLRTTLMLGVFGAGGAVFVYICLWGFWWLVAHAVGVMGSLREWIPKWFESQTDLNMAYKISVESNTEAMRDIKATVTETNIGVVKLLAIVQKEDYE